MNEEEFATIQSTGHYVSAANKHGAQPPAYQEGQHLWVFIGVWRVTDPASRKQVFDTENMITIEGPGCYWCEKHYDEAADTCPGDPGDGQP